MWSLVSSRLPSALTSSGATALHAQWPPRCLGALAAAACRSSSSGTKNGADAHIPVMPTEVLQVWLPEKKHEPMHLIDGTVGMGGHALAAMQSNEGSDLRILGIDRDARALQIATRRAEHFAKSEQADSESVRGDATSRLVFHHGSFSDITPTLLDKYAFPSRVDGILLDLGMNSTQIDTASRGFTFRKHGPLDMRFDQGLKFDNASQENNDDLPDRPRPLATARDIVNSLSASELAAIFQNYADEPYAKQIADHLVKWRDSDPHPPRSKLAGIRSTLELRYIIEEAVEKHTVWKKDKNIAAKVKKKFQKYRTIWRFPGKRPYSTAKQKKLLRRYGELRLRHANHVMRCFQALRIEVNDELEHIRSFFHRQIASNCLKVGGRLAVIAFHPGEDNIVREEMNKMVATEKFKLLTPEAEGMRPALEEVKVNGRSRTARLRAVERIA